MNTKKPTPVNETAPSPIENPIDPRYLRLLKHPYFAAPADLPPSPRKWEKLARESAAQAVKSQESEKRWEGTTPLGREIIRKQLFTLKRLVLAAVAERPRDVLRRFVPDYLALVSARKSSPSHWKRCCDAAVDALVRGGRAEDFRKLGEHLCYSYRKAAWPVGESIPPEAFRPAGEQLCDAYQKAPWVMRQVISAEEIECRAALAAELTSRLKSLSAGGQPH